MRGDGGKPEILMNPRVKAYLLIPMLVATVAAISAAASSLSLVEGKVVSVTGTLDRTWGFGRPNFGEDPETDEIEPYIVLRLPQSITVRSFENVPTTGVSRI